MINKSLFLAELLLPMLNKMNISKLSIGTLFKLSNGVKKTLLMTKISKRTKEIETRKNRNRGKEKSKGPDKWALRVNKDNKGNNSYQQMWLPVVIWHHAKNPTKYICLVAQMHKTKQTTTYWFSIWVNIYGKHLKITTRLNHVSLLIWLHIQIIIFSSMVALMCKNVRSMSISIRITSQLAYGELLIKEDMKVFSGHVIFLAYAQLVKQVIRYMFLEDNTGMLMDIIVS